MPKFIELTGQTFHRWTVIERAPDKAPGVGRWLCRCECGTERAVYASLLKGGGSQSCGCLTIERHPRKHGHTGKGRRPSKTYTAWDGMIQRCTNPRHGKFARYGGRGITVCERWRSSFEAFLADMGECPAGLTLDRRDNDGNYEPGNCRWATRKVQQNNRSACHYITHNGETLSVTDWAERLGLVTATILERIAKGWPMERVMTSERFYGPNGNYAGRANNREITANGETKTLAEWGRVTGLGLKRISARINKLGWTPERAVQEPVRADKRRRDYLARG